MLSLNVTVCLALTLCGVLGPLEVIAPSSSLIGGPRVLSGDCLFSWSLVRVRDHPPAVQPSAFGLVAPSSDPSKIKVEKLNQILGGACKIQQPCLEREPAAQAPPMQWSGQACVHLAHSYQVPAVY